MIGKSTAGLASNGPGHSATILCGQHLGTVFPKYRHVLGRDFRHSDFLWDDVLEYATVFPPACT
jgi:hypothetical protein